MRETISRYAIFVLFAFSVAVQPARPASKPHIVSFGKWRLAHVSGPGQEGTVETKVRPLYVDGKLKEFTVGEPHQVTERLFVIRKAFRLNDSLPPDTAPRWIWQLGEWLLVDRGTGKIAMIRLPGHDPFYSHVSWYRDYAAYCGFSSSGATLNATVVKIGARKPLLRKELGPAGRGRSPDSECSAPRWERQPARVTFLPKRLPSMTYAITGPSLELVPDENAD